MRGSRVGKEACECTGDGLTEGAVDGTRSESAIVLLDFAALGKKSCGYVVSMSALSAVVSDAVRKLRTRRMRGESDSVTTCGC